MKVLIAQTGPSAGGLEHNFNLIKKYYSIATDQKADICLFPELATTGYYCEDLFLKPSFIKAMEAKVEELLPLVGEVALCLPTPIREQGNLYNGVIVIHRGKIIAQSHKHHLPSHGIFDEKRYFTSGVPSVIEINGHLVGIPICEDIWHSNVCLELKNQGVEALLVPNGSPYDLAKLDRRLAVVRERFQQTGLPIIYCNQVLGHDGIVFDGRSFAYDGELKIQMPIFEEAHSLVTIEHGRITSRQLDEPKLDPLDEIYGALVFGLREYLSKNGISSVVVGLSGGIDSALVATIAADAIGADRVKAVMMPSRFTSKESLEDAESIVRMLRVQYQVKPIDNLVHLIEKEVLTGLKGIASENLQSRLRGLILMSISNNENRLVLTTGNKSEMATGYATLYGDMCGGFNPIKDLYKTRVFAVSRFRNANLPKSVEVKNKNYPIMPERVISKPPSAELKENQKDTDSLPEYEILDQILELYIEKDLGQEEIVSKGFDPDTVAKIADLVKRAEFKRKQAAPGIKITTRNLEKDRRYPITG